MSLPWVGSPLDPTTVRALWSTSRGMSLSWGRRRPPASSPALPSPPFRISKPLSISRNLLFSSLETILKCKMVST
ncbi:hypothetical protein BHE74_00018429 [Ensete ventricosum]|uniref:Uncharacterized protein n=1 Tax=Ensete ventricosum TaxID=4639 RepID=A0A426ZHP5_ENSVE|nr:hypothetical protein B296_00031910 [Ensete ventricosum]RWW21512.1 hypothetical protein GW17_00014341 [Ensete ventricosum]RWW73696.1 hypothetical protein BHE74_00018429 [Ensete ventricosum]RZR73261.1 hypothetical protein BHM03_00022034 [Ensete ventricosum]